jgi:D-alanyl-lipoteichoic acid acyltransferase DltB (MBOAT superfamily)
MLFNSYTFLFLFLPLTLAGAFVLARYRTSFAVAWLVLASLFFYGWWSWRHVPLLLASIAFNYLAGAAIVRRGGKLGGRAFGLLCAAVALNLAVLGYFKYAGFLVANVDALFGAGMRVEAIVLPLGISFFTFTQIAYLVDVYRDPVRYGVVPYALFVSYFPHLIAGPILHHREMMPQFAAPTSYRFDYGNLAAGLTIFAIGLFKKTVLADGIAPYASPVYAQAAQGYAPGLVEAWGAAVAFGLQLYFDFSAYSDMAVGLSKMLGIRMPVNFESPYKATSIIEFWRRWHMTLSRFLRDYLYIALGGNRRGTARRYANLVVTMLLGGLWHGAAWTFVLWGALHGACLALNHGWIALRRRLPPGPIWMNRIGTACGAALTFVAVFGAWTIFRADDFPSAFRIVSGLVGMNGYALPPSALAELAEAARSIGQARFVPSSVGHWIVAQFGALDAGLPTGIARGRSAGVLVSKAQLAWVSGLFAVAWLAPNTRQIMVRAEAFIADHPVRHCPAFLTWRIDGRWAVASALLLAASLTSMTRVSEFLYFQF